MTAPDRVGIWEPGKRGSLWDMLEVNGRIFVSAIDGLRDAQDVIGSDPSWLVIENLGTWFEMLSLELGNLGCRQTLKKLEAVKDLVVRYHQFDYSPETKARNFNKQMSEVWSRLKDELEDQKLYCITAREAEALGPVADVYGSSVATTFNDVIFDLEEASKSLAFGRGTAGVFHLMRAMEVAVTMAGKKLDAVVLDKNDQTLEWGKVLANMTKPIEALDRGQERDNWSEALSLLYHVKQAWRNNTMHPKQTYTLEEAGEVLAAVRSFLRRLAPLV